jgi:hypothetical protein
MKKSGQPLESLIRIVHETLKTSDKTVIYSNYKIKNSSGRNREFDVFIISEINTVPIQIAIECKDYKRKVEVEKIEAFNSKCARYPQISKKVFVSVSGYQEDAKNAAKDFGIELIEFKKISPELILSWFQISQITDKFQLQLPARIQLVGDKDKVSNINLPIDFKIEFYENKEPIELVAFLLNLLKENIAAYRLQLLYEFMKSQAKTQLKHKFPLIITLKGTYLTYEEEKFDIRKIEADVLGWFDEVKLNITEARQYTDNFIESKANTISFDFDKAGKTDLVLTNNGELGIFLTKDNGNTYRLVPLVRYDPKTDSFENQ